MSPRLRRLLPPLALVLLALAPVWRAVLLGEAIGPVAQIYGPDDGRPWNVLQADSLLQFRVWRSLVFESWSHGAIPYWNPYSLLGTPLLANSQSGALYPFHILAGALRLPLDRAIGALAWVHLALAGLGTYRLSRALGCDRASAFFGGSAFALSAFLLAWTPLASVPTTVAWIPWLLFWIAHGRAGGRQAAGWMALCFGMMLLAGHLQFAFYGGLAAGLFAVAYGGRSSLRVALPALVLGALLAAPQVGAALAFGERSHRRAPATDEGYAAYSRSALQPWQLATVPAAQAHGLPNDGVQISPGRVLTGYWPSLVKPGENFAEAAVGLGPAVFLLLPLVPWRRREAWSIGLVALLGLLLAMPTLVNRLVYFGVPGWSATGSPGRAAVLFVLGGCVLGALGFARFRTLPVPYSMRTAGTIIGSFLLAIIVVSTLGSLAPKNVLGIPEDAFAGIKTLNVILPVGAIGATFAAQLLLLAVRAKGPDLVRYGALLPALFALGTYGRDLIPTGVVPAHNVPRPSGERVAVENERWSLFTNPNAFLPPNLLANVRILGTGGYDSLIDRDTKALLDGANGRDSSPPENGNMMFVKPGADRAKLRELGVSELWRRGAGGTPAVERIGGAIATVDGAPARIAEVDAGGFTLVSARSGEATVRFRNLPGWRAGGRTIGGEGPWISARVEAGRPTRFVYAPGSPPLAYAVLLAGLALFAFLTVGGVRRRAASRQNPTSAEAPSP